MSPLESYTINGVPVESPYEFESCGFTFVIHRGVTPSGGVDRKHKWQVSWENVPIHMCIASNMKAAINVFDTRLSAIRGSKEALEEVLKQIKSINEGKFK